MFDEKKFRARMVLFGYTFEKLAKELGINVTTLHQKVKRHGAFSREEIYKLMKILKMTYEEMNEIFFTDELTDTQVIEEVE